MQAELADLTSFVDSPDDAAGHVMPSSQSEASQPTARNQLPAKYPSVHLS